MIPSCIASSAMIRDKIPGLVQGPCFEPGPDGWSQEDGIWQCCPCRYSSGHGASFVEVGRLNCLSRLPSLYMLNNTHRVTETMSINNGFLVSRISCDSMPPCKPASKPWGTAWMLKNCFHHRDPYCWISNQLAPTKQTSID